MMADLKPCPFCGSAVDVGSVGEPGVDGEPTVWRVDCECMWDQHETKEQAAERWNKRRSDGLRNWLKAELVKVREANDQWDRMGNVERVYESALKQAEKLLDRPVTKE